MGVSGKGVEVLDISRLDNIVSVKLNEDINQPTAMGHHGGSLFVADGRRGVQAITAKRGLDISVIGTGTQLQGSIEDIQAIEDVLYLASCQHGLQVLRRGEGGNSETNFWLRNCLVVRLPCRWCQISA